MTRARKYMDRGCHQASTAAECPQTAKQETACAVPGLGLMSGVHRLVTVLGGAEPCLSWLEGATGFAGSVMVEQSLRLWDHAAFSRRLGQREQPFFNLR